MNPIAPKIVKSALIIVNPDTGAQQRIIMLQYNPDSLKRSLQSKAAGENSDRLEAHRLIGPPVETITLEAELDAADQLEFPEENKTVVSVGVRAQLAALEVLLYPSTQSITDAQSLASSGTIEILPASAPLTLFHWGLRRLLPVRITEFSVVEEAFDIELNPIRAKVSIGMRVLSVNDTPYSSLAGSLYMVHHDNLERLARQMPFGSVLD